MSNVTCPHCNSPTEQADALAAKRKAAVERCFDLIVEPAITDEQAALYWYRKLEGEDADFGPDWKYLFQVLCALLRDPKQGH